MSVIRRCANCATPNRIPPRHLADGGRCFPFFAVFRGGSLRWHQAGLTGAAHLVEAALAQSA